MGIFKGDSARKVSSRAELTANTIYTDLDTTRDLYKYKDGKEYIEIDVPPYPIGISCKGVYYYRSGSTRQILTGPALEAFLMRKRGATWDNLPLPAFSLDDVDDETVLILSSGPPKRDALTEACWMSQRTCSWKSCT